MDTDLMFVVGAVILCLAIPSILSAFIDGRPPRVAAVALFVGGALVVVALRRIPGGVEIADVPYMFLRVIARVLN